MMDVFFNTLPQPKRLPSIVTWGNFDGMHLGHQAIMQALKESDLNSTVVLFDPHPKVFFNSAHHIDIMCLNDKIQFLASMGINQVLVCDFNASFSRLSAQQFLQKIVINEVLADTVVLGHQAHFGADRKGDLALAASMGLKTMEIAWHYDEEGRKISSTLLRKMLQQGDVALVNRMIGRRWSLQAKLEQTSRSKPYILQALGLKALGNGAYPAKLLMKQSSLDVLLQVTSHAGHHVVSVIDGLDGLAQKLPDSLSVVLDG